MWDEAERLCELSKLAKIDNPFRLSSSMEEYHHLCEAVSTEINKISYIGFKK